MTAPKPRWYVVFDQEGRACNVLDAEAEGCGGTWTLSGPPCGGCDACQHAQAVHYGCEVRAVVPVGLETLGDAIGRVEREIQAEPPRAPLPVFDDAVDEAF